VAHHRQVDKTLVSKLKLIVSASLKQIHFLSGLYWNGGVLTIGLFFCLAKTSFVKYAASNSSLVLVNLIS
jgi:hypothetical protein